MYTRFLMLFLLPGLIWAQPLDRVVAIVNENVITERELNQELTKIRQQIAAQGIQAPEERLLRKQALNHLIDVDLQMQLAKKNHVTVEAADIDVAQADIAKRNHLSLEKLREALQAQGIDWKMYRENLKQELLLGRVQQKAVSFDATVSKKQIDDYLKTAKPNTSQNTYHLFNIVVPTPEAPSAADLEKAKQKAYGVLAQIRGGRDFKKLALSESTGEFILEGSDLGERRLNELPEVFAKEVIHMKKGDIAGPIRTGNGYQLIKLVDIGGEKVNYRVQKTHVRHILIKEDASMTSEEAKLQVQNIVQQLKSGKDFALLAKQYSLDSVSGAKGGDLGWVSPGDLVPEFEKEMNEAPLNQISQPVKSRFGWHIIQVLERKSVDETSSLERQQAKAYLQQQNFTDAVQNWLQQMRASAYVKVVDKSLA